MKFIAISSIALLLAQQVLAKPAEGCLQNYTITEIDSCFSVAAQFQITEPEFYSMNPGLHHSVQHDCDNLDTGKPFCVCMKAPCPVPVSVAPVAPAASAASAVPTELSSSSAAVMNSYSSSFSSSLSSSYPSSHSLTTASSVLPASTTPSSSVSASSQGSDTKTGSAMTNTISAITIGLAMTAVAAVLI